MTNITRAYAGNYVCSADNGVGRFPVRESITLDVLCEYDHLIIPVSKSPTHSALQTSLPKLRQKVCVTEKSLTLSQTYLVLPDSVNYIINY